MTRCPHCTQPLRPRATACTLCGCPTTPTTEPEFTHHKAHSERTRRLQPTVHDRWPRHRWPGTLPPESVESAAVSNLRGDTDLGSSDGDGKDSDYTAADMADVILDATEEIADQLALKVFHMLRPLYLAHGIDPGGIVRVAGDTNTDQREEPCKS